MVRSPSRVTQSVAHINAPSPAKVRPMDTRNASNPLKRRPGPLARWVSASLVTSYVGDADKRHHRVAGARLAVRSVPSRPIVARSDKTHRPYRTVVRRVCQAMHDNDNVSTLARSRAPIYGSTSPGGLDPNERCFRDV